MPRPSWRRYSRKPPLSAMRSTASRSCAPQSHRWLPNTSPVRHSLWGRTSGLPRLPAEATADARSPKPNATCSRPSRRPSKVKTRARVEYPSEKRSGASTCVRVVARGTDMERLRSVVLEAFRERVAQQHDVADLADLREPRAAPGVPGELAVVH